MAGSRYTSGSESGSISQRHGSATLLTRNEGGREDIYRCVLVLDCGDRGLFFSPFDHAIFVWKTSFYFRLYQPNKMGEFEKISNMRQRGTSFILRTVASLRD
jgi:hypothetical protein